MLEERGEVLTRARWWSDGRLPAFVLGILLLFSLRGALSGQVFYLRDISQNHYPIRHYVTDRLLAGDLPLWDPLHGGGTPLLANPNNLILHPITALFFTLPFDAAFTASIVLQIALLAIGGYLLARRVGASREGAALAAAILSLSGPAASLASLQNVLCAFAWVPLGLWLFLRGIESGRRASLAGAALVFAVVLIAAEPASALAFVLLAPILALAAGPGSHARDRRAPAVVLALGAVMVVACLIAAAQILPARELLPLSTRGAGFTAQEGMKWSLHPFRMLEIVMPRLLGDPTRLHPASWWGGWLFEGRYPFLLSIYAGVIPCCLALLAMFGGGPGKGRRRALGVVGALGLLLALGGNGVLYRALYSFLPTVAQIRYPERFLLVTLVAMALLAALGLDRLTDRTAGGARRRMIGCAIVAGALFLLGTLFAALPGLADRLLSFGAGVPAAILGSDIGAVLRGATLRSVLWSFGEAAVLSLCALVALSRRAGRQGRVAVWGIVVASGLSMTLAASPALSTADPGWVRAQSPLQGVVGHGQGAPRVYHEPRPPNLSVWGKTDELAWGYRYDRFIYALGSGHLDGVPSLFDPATDRMDLRASSAIGRHLQDHPLDARLRILGLGHAGYMFTYEERDHPRLEEGPVLDGFSRPPLRVYRLRDPLPRVRWVPQAIPPRDPDDPLSSLLDPDFDPARAILLEGANGTVENAVGPDAGQATIIEDLPERLRVDIESRAPGYLVIADAFAPGWTARIDGDPAEILRANGMFRAVRVATGTHSIEMRYAPVSVRRGLWLSTTGLLLTIGWAVGARRMGR